MSHVRPIEPDVVKRRRILAAIDDPRWILLERGEVIARNLELDGFCYRRKKSLAPDRQGARGARAGSRHRR